MELNEVHSIHLEAIDRQSKSPIYRQIAEQIRLQISDGRVPVGTRLPTVRELAVMLSVTRLPALNAYRELQAGGWVASAGGRVGFGPACNRPDASRATHRPPITA